MRQRHTRYRWIRTNASGFTLLAGLLLGTAACGDAFIDPFDNDERYYSIYGFIDEAKNFVPGAEQAVRVIPLTRFPERILTPTDPQAFIDATVTSTDMRTGETTRWRHSLDRLSDGTFAHIFRARFFVRPGRTYRLEVRRSDGVTASAETKTPSTGLIETNIGAPRVDPETGTITQEIHLSQVPSPWDIEVIYRLGDSICFGASPQTRSYGRVGALTEDGDWRFTINLTGDLDQLLSAPNLCAMGLKIRLLDGNWTPPEGVFDPEVLAQPGTLSNVENGYGFWGSIALYQHDWTISDELRDLLGF